MYNTVFNQIYALCTQLFQNFMSLFENSVDHLASDKYQELIRSQFTAEMGNLAIIHLAIFLA